MVSRRLFKVLGWPTSLFLPWDCSSDGVGLPTILPPTSTFLPPSCGEYYYWHPFNRACGADSISSVSVHVRPSAIPSTCFIFLFWFGSNLGLSNDIALPAFLSLSIAVATLHLLVERPALSLVKIKDQFLTKHPLWIPANAPKHCAQP